MSLSVVLMCHPERRRWVYVLGTQLDRKAKIIWDETNDVWDTGRRALLAADPDSTHTLIIQDDAVIPRRLVEGAERIIEHTPDNAPVSLYMGRWRHRPQRYSMKDVTDLARDRRASFAVLPGPYWGVGIIVPTKDIEDIVAYGDENREGETNYDLRIARYYTDRGIDCWYTMPSVVNHRMGPSLIGRRGARRHAQWMIDRPLLDVDWSGGVITADDLPHRFPPLP